MPPASDKVQAFGLYAFTIFVSAFLLFQVQPVMARMILPWFGGSAAVWTICMLFFQITLLLGYLYAHWTTERLLPRVQARIHAGLLAASLLLLPVIPAAAWKPAGPEDPTLRILCLLAATVGLPYFMLSTSGPLVQAWYVRRRGAVPYRLYALSNIGSMLALLSYPVLVEPHLAARAQAQAWSGAYVLFVALTVGLALRRQTGADPETAASAPGPAPEGPPGRVRIAWMALPACASALLLAVTNHMTQNVAAIPFLWVLPLSLYLMSFIVCFDRETWYRRWLFIPLLAAALGGMAWSMLDIENISIKPLILLFSAGLFFACIVCHGELARLKPHPRHLTSFYLMISLGGALGGLVVGLAAPYLLNGEYELPAILAACAVLAAALPFRTPLPRPLKWLGAAAATGIIVTLAVGVHTTVEDNRLRVRNFYGSLRVLDSGGGREAVRRLLHGAIDHGEQYLSPERSRQATTYYGTNSGVGVAIRHFQSPGQRMGFIGLGAGTLAAYGRRGDSYRFYEINPLVERIARTEFQYLRQSEAAVAVALGDARLSLEQEAPRQFSVLAVDAFSGDAIPVHLLTREAFQLYFRHLDPDGILAVHISNRYLDLQPVVEQAARSLGKETLTVESASDDDRDVFESTWVLVAGQPFQDAAFKAAGVKAQAGRTIRTWTDEYSNLFQVLR